MKVRKLAFIALSAVVIAIIAILMVNTLGYVIYGKAFITGPGNKTAVVAQQQQGAGASLAPGYLGVVGFVLLILAMGMGMIGVVLALVTVIAIFQMYGGGWYQYVAYAFALGLAISSLSRGVKPMLPVPRSMALLMAVLGAILVAVSDMSLFASAMIYVALILAQLLLAFMSGMGSAGILVAVGWLLAATWIARAAAGAKGLAGTILSIAAALIGIQVAVIMLQFLLSAATTGIGIAVLLVAGIVAIVDMFQALEKARIEALIWVAPLAILASALYDIQLAPIIAGMAGVAAVLGAFTLSSRWINTAVVLAISALVMI